MIVQIENSDGARPQVGLGSAEALWEYETEGGITRISAVFATAVAADQQVGPVRSARLATVALLAAYRGLLLYSGSSHAVGDPLKATGLPSVDEETGGGDLYRDPSAAPPHNLFTDGAHIADLLRTAAPAPVTYPDWPRGAPAAGAPVTSVTVPLSPAETPSFQLRPDAGGWVRTEPDTGTFVDRATGAPLAAAAVLVLEVPVEEAPDVIDSNGAHGVIHHLESGGRLRLFTAAGAVAGTWAPAAAGPPALTLDAGGPAVLPPGPVWVELVRPGTAVTAG